MAISFSGCWDSRELGKMLIVSGIAVDKGEYDNINITILSFQPKALKSTSGGESTTGSNQVVIFSEEGRDVLEACNKISKKLSREIFLSQLESIIIGEELAKEGVEQVLDFFVRNSEPTLNVLILFSKGKASDIFKAQTQLESDILEQIDKILSINPGLRMNIKDFIYALTEEGIEPYAPLLEVVNNERNIVSGGARTVAIERAAIFYNDKLISIINYEEYKGLLYIQNKIKSVAVTVNVPTEKLGMISGNIMRTKTKVKPVLMDGKIEINVSIYAISNITENTSNLDLSKPDTVYYVEELIQKNIEKNMKDALIRLQKQLATDVFGFGAKVHGQYPKQWKESFMNSWDEKLPDVKINLACMVEISEIGSDMKSLPKK
jgi:spore germination protein KC